MASKVITVEQYLDALPDHRKVPVNKLREQILKNLPEGVKETISYGMLGYVIPHTVYPNGYHCNPKLPLPFMNLASQKNFIAVNSPISLNGISSIFLNRRQTLPISNLSLLCFLYSETNQSIRSFLA